WAQGQPKVKIMGREVPVLKRWDYQWSDPKKSNEESAKTEEVDLHNQSSERLKTQSDEMPALWGLDLEALRSSSGSDTFLNRSKKTGSLPIFAAESARSYLLRSFASATPVTGSP